MKFDPIFYVKDNNLYKIADNSLVKTENLKKIEVSWTTVEIQDELYNEEFLANLREKLKSFELQNIFVIIIPKVDKELKNSEQEQAFINAFNHTARRIKDCVCVAGFALPQEIIQNGFGEDSFVKNFTETLKIKHPQYVYFVSTDDVQRNNFSKEIQNLSIVLY